MVKLPLSGFDQHKFFSQVERIFIVCLLFYFSLNFLGSPLLKYVYLVFPLIIAISLLTVRPRETFLLFFLYLWIEGQGRVLWGYVWWARVIFDLLLAWAIFKEFYQSRSIFHPHSLPIWIKALIGLHFVIFTLELFNPIGVGPIAAVATSKIYIYPVLLFLFFNSTETFKGELIERIVRYGLAMALVQCLLSYYQMYQGHSFMLGISPHYYRAMGGGKFLGPLFRPFGTSFVAGGISTYLYALVPILYLERKYIRYALALVPFIFVTLFMCQVRSAMVKLLAFLSVLFLLLLMFRQLKLKSIVQLLIVLAVVIPLSANYVGRAMNLLDKIDLAESQSRFSRLTEGGQRHGPGAIYGILAHRLLQAPLGHGPGLTGAAASIGMESFLENKLVTIGDVWSYDNFYLSLFTDFGVLALVYLSLLMGIPIVAVVYFWRKKRVLSSQQIYQQIVALSALVVLFLGNWGAIGLPYNPESFAFWYYMSILTVGISKANA